MKIKQFEDKGLSHYSYAILSESKSEIALVDPSRDISQYLDFSAQHKAKIVAVIETHPHADFVSGHLELHKTTGAVIYCSKLVGAEYPHQHFDDGDNFDMGKIRFKALNTPGHSPDSISIVLEHERKQKAVFTGDTLFIGDCGRPDLRENAGNFKAIQKDLAVQMYHSLRKKLMILTPETIVYPSHGAGTLCGKSLSEASESTIGAEIKTNWSMSKMPEQEFVEILTTDQPFIPHYFSFDVELNKSGAVDLNVALVEIPAIDSDRQLISPVLVIDGRPESDFKKGHHKGAINIQNGGKFETWLGSIVKPNERFCLIGSDEKEAKDLLYKASKIGYERNCEGILFQQEEAKDTTPKLDLADFRKSTDSYTIVDVRNKSETKEGKIFPASIEIPLYELRQRASEIPLNKPIVVHCAGGYRSAAGSSILEGMLNGQQKVFDLGEDVKEF